MRNIKKLAFLYAALLLLPGCAAQADKPTLSQPPILIPTPTEMAEPSLLPTETPYPATELLVAENGEYTLYWTDRTEDEGWTVLGFDLRDASGLTLQRLEERTDSNAASPDDMAAFEDLNFDGYDDIKIAYSTVRYPEYDAFLWDPATKQFREERSFTQILHPIVAEPYMFGEGSSGAAHSYLYYYDYDAEKGYTQRGRLSANGGIGVTGSNDLDAGWGESLMDEEGRLISVKRCLNGKELNPIWTQVGAAYYDKWGDPCADEELSARYFENAGPYLPVLELELAYSEILHGNLYPLADRQLAAELEKIFEQNREKYLGIREEADSYYRAPWEYRRLVTAEQLERYDGGRLALRLMEEPSALWVLAYEDGKVISVDPDDNLRASLEAERFWWSVSLP